MKGIRAVARTTPFNAPAAEIMNRIETIAGPPVKIHKNKSSDSENPSTTQSNNQSGQPGGTATVRPPANQNPDPDDDADDDDEEANDPLAHLFESQSGSSFGNSTLPIVGVAPKLKGPAAGPLRLGTAVINGLKNYEEWVFIYIPPNGQNFGPGNPNPPPPGGRPQISQ